MKAITVCVEYDDLLDITLRRNVRHFEEVLVVTSPEDLKTQEIALSVPKVRLYITDVFYTDGCPFRKAAAIEEAFDVLGREGWICLLDADTLLPPIIEVSDFLVGYLYSPLRRLLLNPAQWTENLDWTKLPYGPEAQYALFSGYCQIFHADDPAVRARPWYNSKWMHAGGCDTEFERRWAPFHKERPGFEVLHLGQLDTNWCGRVTARADGTTPREATNRSERLWRLGRNAKLP